MIGFTIADWVKLYLKNLKSKRTTSLLQPRMLEMLAGCLTELCASHFYWIFFHFGFLWYSSFVINFPRFFKRYFRPMKILPLRYPQNNYQIWLYKLNLMCEELFYQIINISAVNQAIFCYYYKFAKIITEKKTLVLTVARNEEMHFFEFT